jgi:hypothetical protein
MSEPTAGRAHLCLVQPAGYIHSLGLLDPLLYLKHQLERLGVDVSIGKNRLASGAVNYIFGAHLGFDPAWTQEFSCVFVNLEQLGADGALVSPSYLRLLAEHSVIDYHPDNVRAYRAKGAAVPLLGFGYSASGSAEEPLPLEQRPIDLLFVGSLLPRRSDIIERIERTGVRVAVPERPLYGAERDALIRQSKAVLNISAYSASRFEQVRASLVLSAGTPVVSERRSLTGQNERAYEPFVQWFDLDRLEDYFTRCFGSATFFEEARRSVAGFRDHDPLNSVKALWQRDRRMAPALADITELHGMKVALGLPEGDYRPGWLNIGTDARCVPDVLVQRLSDLEAASMWTTRRWGRIRLTSGCARVMDLGLMTPHDHDTDGRLAVARELLEENGRVVLEWPRDASLALLEAHTDSFWRSGGSHHRLALARTDPVDLDGAPCEPGRADRWRIVLTKVPCSIYDATVARAATEDLEALVSH